MKWKPIKFAVAVLLTVGVICFVVALVANLSTAAKSLIDTVNYPPAEERQIEAAHNYVMGAVCGFTAGIAALGAASCGGRLSGTKIAPIERMNQNRGWRTVKNP